jgi:hypothetical protein
MLAHRGEGGNGTKLSGMRGNFSKSGLDVDKQRVWCCFDFDPDADFDFDADFDADFDPDPDADFDLDFDEWLN